MYKHLNAGEEFVVTRKGIPIMGSLTANVMSLSAVSGGGGGTSGANLVDAVVNYVTHNHGQNESQDQ